MAIFPFADFPLLTSLTSLDHSPYLSTHAVPIHSSRYRFFHAVFARMLQVVVVPIEDLLLQTIRDDQALATIIFLDKDGCIIEDDHREASPSIRPL